MTKKGNAEELANTALRVRGYGVLAPLYHSVMVSFSATQDVLVGRWVGAKNKRVKTRFHFNTIITIRALY